jgi:hypothetical protein
MEASNSIFIVIGLCITLVGIAAFFYPNIARIISVPGGPRQKAIIAVVVGIVIAIIGFTVQIS